MTDPQDNQNEVLDSTGPSTVTNNEKHIKELERELQSARLELEKQEELARRLSQDFEVYKRNQFDVVKGQVDFAFEILFTNIAASVSHLETMRHLLSTHGETKIQPKDVLQAANTVVSQLESHELQLIGKIGDIVGFDGNIHQLCGSFEEIRQSEKVKIISVGVSFRGKILQRVLVMLIPETHEALDT